MKKTQKEQSPPLIHWADMTAERLCRQLGNPESFTLASGITPSGTVHFGNFREVITVDFVAKALKDRGKKVRFIFSWDDYDTFRKIPQNMPKQEELKNFLFHPIVDTPDPFEKSSSYASHQEEKFEDQLKKVGIELSPLYQAKKYRAGDYRESIELALEKREEIAAILNKYRKVPLPKDWLPLSLYCEKCNTDHQITEKKFFKEEGEKKLSYKCENCGHQGEEKLSESTRVKLPWRVDWPMRWAFEKVDFEPGGKDHSSQGGSYTTAKDIVKLFGWRPPLYLQYDFVSIKGRGGKMSSSSGDVVTVNDVLGIYEPEIVRWIFASYKSNVDFSISFDLDVIKTYEDFDRGERLAYGLEQGNEKKVNMAKRVYALSQVEDLPQEMPFQPSFRHLTNVLQINDGDLKKSRQYYEKEIKNQRDERRFQQRAKCALHWLERYAPEDFKFSINAPSSLPEFEENVPLKQRTFLFHLKELLLQEGEHQGNDKALHEALYKIIHAQDLSPSEVFPLCYRILISKEKGPKLAGFIRTIGSEKVVLLIESFLERFSDSPLEENL